MAGRGGKPVAGRVAVALGSLGVVLAVVGLFAFNLGYVEVYGALFLILCIGGLLFVEVGADVFLPLLLLAAAGTLVYAVGLFALPLVLGSLLVTAPVAVVLRRWGIGVVPDTVRGDGRPYWRALELMAVLLVALFARYVVYRAVGGHIPLRISELESLTRFLFGEVSGWGVFALAYGVQHRARYGALYSSGVEFASSFPAFLAAGLFLVSPHVAIMTLGLNTFGVAGLYVGALPVGAAHILMRTLTLRREEIEWQNRRLQQMNLELARNERLAAIGQMSSAISHQILQKVGLLGLQCDLLRDSLGDAAAPAPAVIAEAGERVGQIDDTITDLNATLSDLLVFSRDFALHVDHCSLDQLLHELTQEIQPAAQARAVTIRYRCEDGGAVLPLDRIKFKQALLNIVKNAVEASPSPGQVDVILRGAGGAARVAVHDRGRGIPPGELEHVFSPFYTTKAKGAGLGLTFAQKIVELHRGKISAGNDPDGGATFVVELPTGTESEV